MLDNGDLIFNETQISPLMICRTSPDGREKRSILIGGGDHRDKSTRDRRHERIMALETRHELSFLSEGAELS